MVEVKLVACSTYIQMHNIFMYTQTLGGQHQEPVNEREYMQKWLTNIFNSNRKPYNRRFLLTRVANKWNSLAQTIVPYTTVYGNAHIIPNAMFVFFSLPLDADHLPFNHAGHVSFLTPASIPLTSRTLHPPSCSLLSCVHKTKMKPLK